MYLTRNATKFENQHINVTIRDDLSAVINSISENKGYSLRGKELLSWNICENPNKYVSFAGIAICEEGFNGVAQ